MTSADEGAHIASDLTPNIAKTAVTQGFVAQALHHVVDSLALQHPNRLVAIDEAEQLSYRVLVTQSTGLAQRLLLEGVVPLSVFPLATLCQRGCSWLCIYVACMRLGVPIVALSADLSDHLAESQRNVDVLEKLHPQMLVVQPMPHLSGMDCVLQTAASLNIQRLVLSDLLSQS
jgi:non-ribosomal peptide synthetase component E (peptide arylation enzyme)